MDHVVSAIEQPGRRSHRLLRHEDVGFAKSDPCWLSNTVPMTASVVMRNVLVRIRRDFIRISGTMGR